MRKAGACATLLGDAFVVARNSRRKTQQSTRCRPANSSLSVTPMFRSQAPVASLPRVFKAWSFQSQERKFESGAGESSVSGALSARTKVSARREDRRALLPVSGLKCGQSPTGTSEL